MVVIYRCYYRDVTLYFPALVVNKTPSILIHMFFLVISFQSGRGFYIEEIIFRSSFGFQRIQNKFLHELLLDKSCTTPCLHPYPWSICSCILGCSLHKMVIIFLSFLIHRYWHAFVRAFSS